MRKMEYKISNICEINPPKEILLADNEEISFLPMAAISVEGDIDLSATIQVDKVKNYSVFRNGDVLFAKITPCMENGKGAIASNLKNGYGAGSTEFIVLRPNTVLLSAEWLYLFLSQKSFRLTCQQHMTGSAGQKRTTPKYLSTCVIPVPPLAEQQRIVTRIEELFSKLDKAVETLQTIKKQLVVYRQAVLKEAFSGRLTSSWRLKNSIATASSILDKIKKKKQVIGTYAMMEHILLPELPEHWMWISIGDISTGAEYGTSQKSLKSGKIPVLRMGNVQNGRFNWHDLVYSNDEDEIAKYELHNGDVLFNRTNSPELVGKTASYKGTYPAIFAGYLIRVNQVSDIDSNYLTYYLNSSTAKMYGNRVKTDGVNQSNINSKKLYSYPFPLCSLREQQQIVFELESRLSVCDFIEQTVNTALSQADALRQSILKQAFEGELTE